MGFLKKTGCLLDEKLVLLPGELYPALSAEEPEHPAGDYGHDYH
jgi:hypothetical protein